MLERFRAGTGAAVGVGLGAALLHARALGHHFLNWDDNRFITGNRLFLTGGWAYVRAALTEVQFDAYHPLHLLAYLPDRWLWPESPLGFHALNLLLFGLDAALLFALCRRLGGSVVAAAAATLLFAAHPLTVEPVAWVSARKDLLAAAFFLGALLVEDGRPLEERRAAPGGVALFVGALLSKSSALCLPPILWCWLVWMRGARPRAASWRSAPYALLAIVEAIAVVTIWRGHQMIPLRPTPAPVDVLATLATYARRLLWPSDLAALYPATMPAPALSAALARAGAVRAGGVPARAAPRRQRGPGRLPLRRSVCLPGPARPRPAGGGRAGRARPRGRRAARADPRRGRGGLLGADVHDDRPRRQLARLRRLEGAGDHDPARRVHGSPQVRCDAARPARVGRGGRPVPSGRPAAP